MPHLILIRHGNTFETGETTTQVGARTDMKLTAKGEEQGQAAAAMVAARFLPLGGLIAGPLQRTRRFAELIAAKANAVYTVDERLIEIDYGAWENISSDEIRARYGDAELDAWEKDGAWPESANFAPSLEKLMKNIQGFLAEQHKILTTEGALSRVAVTSNGILRFVYHFITGAAPGPDAKVKTGNYCILTPTPSGWVLTEWNKKPG